MKKILLIILLIAAQNSNAQMAIGKTATDPSAILDLSSSTQGLSVPRMTSAQRDAIVAPAMGLLIYNTEDADYNSYNGATLGWQDFSTGYKTVSATGDISTSSDVAATADGMTLTPKVGTYSVLFNSQFKNTPIYTTTPGVATTSTSILADLALLIKDLDNHFVIGTAEYNSIGHEHYASYDINNVGVGSPISNNNLAGYWATSKIYLYPGAYDEGAAIDFIIGAEVTLDGLGDQNAKFIIRAVGALNTGYDVKIKLINGAQACNVFWLSDGGSSIGATNEAYGNFVARAGAMAVGIGTNLYGRILTSAGALTMGDGTLIVPTETSFIDLRSLVSFLGFTSAGDVNITGAPATTFTSITGDLFTCSAFNNFGVAGAFPGPFPAGSTAVGPPVTLTGYLYSCSGPSATGTGTTSLVENNVSSEGTFSIYKNGVEITDATKTTKTDSTASTITLQTIATVNGTDIIDVRWKTATGNTLLMGNRNLTLIKVK